jgi:hypothetical protein
MSANISRVINGVSHTNASTATGIANPPAVLMLPNTAAPSSIELDELNWGVRYNGPYNPNLGSNGEPAIRSESQMPWNETQTTRISETSIHLSTENRTAVEVIQSWSNPPMNRWRVSSCCLASFGNGLWDSGT